MKIKSVKTQLSLFLALFAIYTYFIEKNPLFLLGILVAVFASVALDSIINYLKNKKFSITESSIVTGLIIGYVISSDEFWWVIALASIFAIASKHLIRFRKLHIFNPAAFGIFLTVMLFGAYTQWNTAYSWHIIIPLGVYLALKIKRISLVMSYFATALLLYAPQAFLHNASLLDIFGYLNYFFIFIMMIEPKTTPARRRSKIIFGIGVASFVFAFYEIGILLEAELFALLTVNFLGALLERRRS